MSFTVTATNVTDDFTPTSQSPYYHVGPVPTGPGQTFEDFYAVPLSQYVPMTRQDFTASVFTGRLLHLTPNNINDVGDLDFAFISCDVESYENTNLNFNQFLSSLANIKPTVTIILYSRHSKVCNSHGHLPDVTNIFSMISVGPENTTANANANAIALETNSNITQAPGAAALIMNDNLTYTDPWSQSTSKGAGHHIGGTTQLAMIILYAITAIITSLFIGIVLSGAVRARRHPERYGPRRGVDGRGGQSRVKGIARAMLETLPVVKFGEHQDANTKKDSSNDVELTASIASTERDTHRLSDARSTAVAPPAHDSAATIAKTPSEPAGTASAAVASTENGDVSGESNVLGCSICTEDFQKGEEVRVLPCDHKFHPECVDPWLLNVSGTCPLCRIDLNKPSANVADGQHHEEHIPAPILQPESNTAHIIQNLRSALSGSREERIAALRRFRYERRNRNSGATHSDTASNSRTSDEAPQQQLPPRGLALRLRERFSVRTRRHGARDSTVESTNGP